MSTDTRGAKAQFQKGCGPRKGRFGKILDRVRPRPLRWEKVPGKGVHVFLPDKPGKPERNGLFGRVKPAVKPKRNRSHWVFEPSVHPPSTNWHDAGWRGLWDKTRWAAHHIWQFFLGYWLNLVGLGFFAFSYYATTQVPAWSLHWSQPHVLATAGLLGIWAVIRKTVIRDTGEIVLRAVFAWLAFTNGASPGRQLKEYGAFSRGLAATRVIPSAAEPEDISWFRRLVQVILSPITVLLAAQPGIWLVLGPALVLGIFYHAAFVWAVTMAFKYAGPAGALIVGRYVFNQLAVKFQGVIIDLFDDHGWKMRPWLGFPVTICAYQRSGLARRYEGAAQRFRVPLIAFVTVFVGTTCVIGYWILHNKLGYLKTHNVLYTKEGFTYMLHHWREAF